MEEIQHTDSRTCSSRLTLIQAIEVAPALQVLQDIKVPRRDSLL